jgi:hypothetical protein
MPALMSTLRSIAKEILRVGRLEEKAPKNAERIRGRHAAITNNFNNWRSRKSWAEKIRGTWEDKEIVVGVTGFEPATPTSQK